MGCGLLVWGSWIIRYSELELRVMARMALLPGFRMTRLTLGRLRKKVPPWAPLAWMTICPGLWPFTVAPTARVPSEATATEGTLVPSCCKAAVTLRSVA